MTILSISRRFYDGFHKKLQILGVNREHFESRGKSLSSSSVTLGGLLAPGRWVYSPSEPKDLPDFYLPRRSCTAAHVAMSFLCALAEIIKERGSFGDIAILLRSHFLHYLLLFLYAKGLHSRIVPSVLFLLGSSVGFNQMNLQELPYSDTIYYHFLSHKR